MIREDTAFEAGEGFGGREGALAALRGAWRESAPRGRMVVVRATAGGDDYPTKPFSGRETIGNDLPDPAMPVRDAGHRFDPPGTAR